MKNKILSNFSIFFKNRSRIEKFIIIFISIFFIIYIFWYILLYPAYKGCNKLKHILPIINNKISYMIYQSNEIRRLTPIVKDEILINNTNSIDENILIENIKNYEIKDYKINITDNYIKIEFKNILYLSLIDWINDMRLKFKLQVSDIRIYSSKFDGRINVEGLLKFPEKSLN